MSRKEKEKEFFAYHTDKFRKAQIADPFRKVSMVGKYSYLRVN
jgi:hypothetical protein